MQNILITTESLPLLLLLLISLTQFIIGHFPVTPRMLLLTMAYWILTVVPLVLMKQRRECWAVYGGTLVLNLVNNY